MEAICVARTEGWRDQNSNLLSLPAEFQGKAGEGGRQTMIGEARYIVDGCDPAACEFAIAVADVWQLRGLGNVLLDRLERQAAASGIQRMVADTLRANRAMIGLAAQAGYTVKASREDAMRAQGGGWYQRATRAHMNCVENLPVYAAIVVALMDMGLQSSIIDRLAVIMPAARVVQTLVHILLPPTNTATSLRFAFYFVQALCMIAMGAIIVMHMLQ